MNRIYEDPLLLKTRKFGFANLFFWNFSNAGQGVRGAQLGCA